MAAQKNFHVVVLGAGNVTGLGPADVFAQIFEHGRAAFLKLHPVQAPLAEVLGRALEPLVAEGLLEIATGGAEVSREAIAALLELPDSNLSEAELNELSRLIAKTKKEGR